MTRKDYVALAEALAEALAIDRPMPDDSAAVWLKWSDCRDSIADVLAKDNSRFDRERFIRACQGE